MKDLAVFLGKSCGEGCWGSVLPNLCSSAYWTETEKTVVYSFAPTGYFPGDQPFQWTPAAVNDSQFGLNFQVNIGSGGKGVAVLLDLVSISIYYLNPANVARKTMAAKSTADIIDILQYGTSVKVNIPQTGVYNLIVYDNVGRILQQTKLRNANNETITLNARCKGYCIIAVEGNGMKQSVKAFVQQ